MGKPQGSVTGPADFGRVHIGPGETQSLSHTGRTHLSRSKVPLISDSRSPRHHTVFAWKRSVAISEQGLLYVSTGSYRHLGGSESRNGNTETGEAK